MTEHRRFTYANVVSTLALVVAVTGGGAAVAASVAKNSVGSPQIRDGQVTTADLAGNAVTSAKVKDGSLTGADVDESSLAPVRAANVYAVTVSSDGTLMDDQSPSTATVERVAPGDYYVDFPMSVENCTYTATLTELDGLVSPMGEISVKLLDGFPQTIRVATFNSGVSRVDLDFGLVVVC